MTNPNLIAHRQQFPALANKTYFNYGGQGPLPQVSQEVIKQTYQRLQEIGPFSGESNAWILQEAAAVRSAIAVELGVAPETIALTEDVTVGCNIALWGIQWKPGDHVLMSDCEHPGIIAIVQELQRRFGIEVSTCPLRATLNEGDPVAVIASQLRPETRLLVISHILWNTGQVLPLAEIVKVCRPGEKTAQFSSQNQVRVLVDAAQSVGVLPLNLRETGVDFYAFTGHKWWCGPEGLGGLYISPDALEVLRPAFIGWRGITVDQKGVPTGWKPDARRYEIATSAYPLYGGLRSAIAFQNQWGTAAERYQRILQLSAELWQRLREIPFVHCLRNSPPEAGLVSFQLTNGTSHQQLVNRLEKQGIMVRTIQNPDCIRACVHYLTLESELEQFVAAILEAF